MLYRQTAVIAAEGTTNVIAMALRQTNHKSALKAAKTRAKILEDRMGVELVRFSRTLRKQNGSLMNRIFS